MSKTQDRRRVRNAISAVGPVDVDGIKERLDAAQEVYPKLKKITKGDIKEHLAKLEKAGTIEGQGSGTDKPYRLRPPDSIQEP